jgi:two-component system, OmpR family, phosphate regulon sensor histidine kinase PhoR
MGPPSAIDPSAAVVVVVVVVAVVCLLALAVSALVAHRALRARHDDLALRVAATEAVLDAVEGAVVVFVEGQAPVTNGRAASLLRRGWTLPHEPGQPIETSPAVFEADRTTPVPPEDHTLVRAARGETFGTRLHWIGEPGDQVAVVCSSRAVVSPRGARGTVFVGWDATELLDSMRVREEFLATVSHELRTPLTSILGYLELHEDAVADGTADTVGRSHLGAVRRSARSLQERIGQLLAVAAPAERLAVRPVDVTALVARAAAEHRQAAVRAGLDLDLEAPESLVWPVDPTALERVVDNLLGNAVKYTDRGSVSLVVGTDRGDLVLTVADTGNGMTETEVSHAFDRFYRGEGAALGAVPGLGIGLAVTKQLVEAHGGTVSVSSRPGAGTRFAVRLPDRQVASSGASSSGSSGGSSSASTR